MNAISAPRSQNFEKRDYQIKGRQKMMEFFAKWIRLELEARPDKELTTAMLINMATGSGKTKTVGDFLNDLYELRERFYKLYPSANWLPINALVLNDRINLVNQLREDFFHGRKANNKPPIFSEAFRKNTEVQTYHSKADEIFETLDMDEDQIEAYMEQNNPIGKITVEKLNKPKKGKHRDSFDFSTFQTALEGLGNVDPYNVIVIDEGQVLTGPKYLESFRKYYKPLPSGHYPLVVVMTATPTNKLRILTGKEIFKYGLAEYISSPNCPKVNYNVVGVSKLTTQEKIAIYQTIDRIKNISDAREKKRQLNEFEKSLQESLSKIISVKQLCSDFMNRVKKKDHTIIFTSSIDEANDVVKELNKQAGDETFAVALHSKAKGKSQDIIDDYNDGKHKIIVAVDMLNQGIDMPKTNNIVFWRNTDSALIFFQQLGRGLRGDEVNIYDYIGGIKNLVWINQVNDEIDEFVEMRRQEGVNVENKKMNIGVDHLTTEPEQEVEGDFDAIKIEYTDDTAKDDEKPYEINPSLILPDIQDVESVAEGEESSSNNELPTMLKDLPKEKVQELVENRFSLQAIVGSMKEMREDIALSKEKIKQALDELGGYEELMKYNKYIKDQIIGPPALGINGISIQGIKIWSIAQNYGFKSKYNLSVETLAGFQEFISFVYGREFVYEKAELNPESIKQAFDDLGGYDVLMEYTAEQITGNGKMNIPSLEIKGAKIHSIAKCFGFQSKHGFSTATPSWFQEFISHIYGKEFKNKLTKESIKQAFDELGGYDALMAYTQDNIIGNEKKKVSAFEIQGKRIVAIVNQYGFVSKYGFTKQSLLIFQELVSFVYGKDFKYEKKELSKREIKRYLDDLGGYDELMKYKMGSIRKSSEKDLLQIEIKGQKIIAIANSYGFITKFGLKAHDTFGFQEFISFVYGKEFTYEKNDKGTLTPKEIKQYFDDLGGYDELVKYSCEEVKSILIKGNKINSISTTYSFKSKYGLHIQTPIGFKEFIALIYGKEFTYGKDKKQEIKQYFDALGGYDKLTKYSGEELKAISFEENKIVSIARLYGFKSKYGSSLQTPIGFQEFISFVYRKEFTYTNEKEDLTEDEIRCFLDSLGGYEELIKYQPKQMNLILLKGNKVNAIAGYLSFKTKYGLNLESLDGFQEFISFVYGKEFIYEKEELTKEEIIEYFDELGGYEELMKYDKDSIGEIEIKSTKIVSIMSAYGFKTKFGLKKQSLPGFQEFISHIYGKEFEFDDKPLSKEEIMKYFDGLGGYDKLMKYISKEIPSISIRGNKIYSIVKFFEFKSRYNLDRGKTYWFQEFISLVYGKEFNNPKR